MIVKFGRLKLFSINLLSLSEILLLFYISSIIIISMVPVGNVISKLIGVVFIFHFVFFQVIIKGVKIYYNKEIRLIFIWLVFCLISGIFALDINLVSKKIYTLLQLLVLLIAGYTIVLQGNIKTKQILNTILMSIVVVYLYGIVTQGNLAIVITKYRLASTAGDPNALAILGAFAVLISVYFYNTEKQVLKKILLLLIICILLFGILKTQSRQGILLVIINLVIYVGIYNIYKLKNKNDRRQTTKKLMISVTIFIVTFLIAFHFFKHSQYYIRFQSLIAFFQLSMKSSNSSLNIIMDTSAFERQKLLQNGIRMWFDHPFFGVGLDNFRAVIKQYWPISRRLYSHNNYIELLATIGIFGTFIYYAVFYSILHKIIKLYKDRNLDINQILLVQVILTIIIGLLAIDFVSVTYYSKFLWIFLMLIISFIDRIKIKNICSIE